MDERDAMLLLTNGRCPASVTSVCGSFFSSACEATWVVKAIRNDGLGPRVPANPCFFPGNTEISKKNRKAIERERAIAERDQGFR